MPGGPPLTASSLSAGSTGSGASRRRLLWRRVRQGFRSDRHARWTIIGVTVVTVVGGVLTFLAVRAHGPVHVVVPQPAAGQETMCLNLSRRLPADLDGRSRRRTQPASPLVHAWGSPPIVLFCGVDRPAELTATSELATVNGVAWLPVEEDGTWRFTAVGRAAYIEVVVPKSARGAPTDPLIDLAEPILAVVPEGAS